jgi:hypothetical protein
MKTITPKKPIFFIAIVLQLLLSNSLLAQLDTNIEAEDQTLAGNTILKLSTVTPPNASGGKWILLKNSPSGSLTLTVNSIPTAGSYKLNIYHFNNNVNQDAALAINGGGNTTITLNPAVWEYQGLATLSSFYVDLNAGTNTFSLTRMAQNLHFDYFTVTTDTPTTPTYTYYVSNDGDDNNDGLTESTPWKTLDKASDAAKIGGLLQPGGKLLFNRDDTFVGQLIIGCSGTKENPLEIGSFGTGELPILTGVGANLGLNNDGDAVEVIKMTDTNHILMNDLWITNDRQVGLGWTGSGNTSYGIMVKATKWGGVSEGLTFRNLKFTDIFGVDMLDWEGKFTRDYYNAQGFFFDSNEDHDGSTSPAAIEVGINDVLIEDCYFYNLGSTGISVRHLGSYNNPISDDERNLNFVIRNNHFEKLGGDGVVFASVNNGLVENNEFIDLGWGDHTSQTDRYYGRGEGCWIWDSHNIMVQYNKQYRASGFGDTYGAAGHVDFYCKNAVFQYNYSEDTEGGFVEILGDCENVTFRYNVSVNDGHRTNGHHRYSIWLSGYVGTGKTPVPSNNSYIYNNTIYLDKTRSKPDIEIFAKNTYIYNNAFYAMNGAQIGAGGVSVDIQSGSELLVSNNLFYGDIATAFTNLDSNKIIAQNPLFTDPVSDNGSKENFNIQAGSPVIDTGKSFPQPSFPMAGIGVFADITEYPLTDAFGVSIDIENFNPNIGASNSYNSQVLGVDSHSIKEKSFTIYPNPVKDDINIQLLKDIKQSDITIYDIQGRTIYNTSVKTTGKHMKVTIPENIKNGIYMIKVSDGILEQASKFILYR